MEFFRNTLLTILVAISLVVSQVAPTETQGSQLQVVAVLAREEDEEPPPFGVEVNSIISKVS